MLNKIRSFPSLLPNSIVATIPTYSPEHGSTHDDCKKLLKTYNTPTYRVRRASKDILHTKRLHRPNARVSKGILHTTQKIDPLETLLGHSRSVEWYPDNFF